MKIDHVVVNIDSKYQTSEKEISQIREAGYLYEPKYGKGTSGFKASNLWIGEEYFELINIVNPNGGGWRPEWTKFYNEGQRGIICVFFEVENIDDLYTTLKRKNIDITKPEWLQFKWFFNLFTRTMPWKNAYLPFFQKIPFQFGFQQMKDLKSKKMMKQYMYPNSIENGISSISNIDIYGDFTDYDINMINEVFPQTKVENNGICIALNGKQKITLINDKEHKVIINCTASNKNIIGKSIKIENIEIRNIG